VTVRWLCLEFPRWPIQRWVREQVVDADAATRNEMRAENHLPAGGMETPIVLHVPTAAEPEASKRAQELDATLRDAVQDLGFVLALGDEGPPSGKLRDADVLARAEQATPSAEAPPTWLVSPRVEATGEPDSFVVRIVAVAPRSRELRVRTETVRGADVAVRGLVLLRDLLRTQRVVTPAPAPCPVVAPAPPPRAHSEGRAVLAVSGALFGGFLAFSMHRVAISGEGDGDPRVLLPLLVLGTGAGFGAAMLAAEEWDVRVGDAWYFTAAAGWGSAVGLFLASGYSVQPLNDRFFWGIGSGLIGASLGFLALTQKHVDEGGALLTHSAAAYGLLAGSAVEAMVDGRTDPFEHPVPTGQGYGTAIGLATGGVLALLVPVPASRVLMLDLGLSLGTLGGAALGSPLVTGEMTPEKTRAFFGITLAGSLLGGAAALWFTRGMRPVKTTGLGMPWAGVVGTSDGPTGPVPAWGAGWRGTF
jgi:hypothetical protein